MRKSPPRKTEALLPEHQAVIGASRITPGHLADLRRSGLAHDTIKLAGFFSLSATAMRDLMGMNAGTGYAIPYPGAAHRDGTPYVRVRLETWPESPVITR